MVCVCSIGIYASLAIMRFEQQLPGLWTLLVLLETYLIVLRDEQNLEHSPLSVCHER